jgi:hypothetical protein
VDEILTEDSLAVRWFAMAKRYMMAANTLLHSPEYAASRALHVPTLHLTGQGIEVLLKANLIGAGLTTAEVKKIGHNLWALWVHDGNEMLRAHTLIEGRGVWEQAKAKPQYADSFTENPDDLLLHYLKDLSALHSAESEYALRYVSDAVDKGPRPFLLAETFLEVADLGLKQPTIMRPHTPL